MDEESGHAPSLNREREVRILMAASRLIVRYGYDKTTIQDIAEEAGVSKGAIYLHFRAKEDLFEALIWYESDRLMDELIRRIDTDSEPLNLFSLYRHTIEALIDNPLLRAIVIQDKRLLGDLIRRLRNSDLVARNMMDRMDFVRGFQQAGLIRSDFTAEEIGHFLMVIRYGLLTIDELIPPSQAPPLERVGILMADVLQRGLAPPDGGDPQLARTVLKQFIDTARAMFAARRQERYGRGRTNT